MNESLIVVLVLAIAAGGYLYYRYSQKQAEARKAREATLSHLALAQEIHDLLYQVNVALEDGEEPPLDMVEKLAADSQSRFFLYGALKSFGKSAHFPKKYFTNEASAESQLVYHLLHVHALNAKPDEIKLVEKYSFKQAQETFDYYVFKFRVNPPHADAVKSWMQGVAGPFVQNAHPYGRALATHSFREKLGTKSAREHVEYAHANEYPTLTDMEKKILQLT